MLAITVKEGKKIMPLGIKNKLVTTSIWVFSQTLMPDDNINLISMQLTASQVQILAKLIRQARDGTIRLTAYNELDAIVFLINSFPRHRNLSITVTLHFFLLQQLPIREVGSS